MINAGGRCGGGWVAVAEVYNYQNRGPINGTDNT
jgi:hypothetical protein